MHTEPGSEEASFLLLKSLLMTALLVLTSGAQAAETKPDIILILADDMGYGDLAIQNPESKIPTTNLDQLAREGMRFTDAHSPSAVCTPTRYSILTGRYAWRSRLKSGVLWEWAKPLIEAGRPTLASLLKNTGYETALIGKWHLGWNWPTAENPPVKEGDTGETVDFSLPISGGPLSAGFDYYFGDDVPNFPPYAFIENNRVTTVPTVLKPESMFGRKGVMVPGWEFSAVMPELKNRAIDYIESRGRQTGRRPYFLFISLTAPHTPVAPDSEYLHSSRAGPYGDFVYQVDDTVGDILHALEKSGQADNTLVIFSSDNGSPGRDGTNMSGETGSVRRFGHDPSRPWRGIKGDAWEGGHRVPMLIRWPALHGQPGIYHKPVMLGDLMATVAEILNIPLPDNAGEDSLSLLPALSGARARNTREAIILHSYEGLFAIRRGKWKLIQGYGGGGISGKKEKPWFWEPEWQLYDLTADPQEKSNVYSDHPDVVRELSELLERYRKSGRSVSRDGDESS